MVPLSPLLYREENGAQRSHVPNLSMVTQLESCRTGTEPRLEPVHCWAILLLSVVVAQQLASLPRVNTSCLLHRNVTKLLMVIRCFLVHRFFFSFKILLAFSYSLSILLLSLSSLLSTETVLMLITKNVIALQIWVIQELINISGFPDQLFLFLFASCPLPIPYPTD